jgi:FkbM family methyltransferase
MNTARSSGFRWLLHILRFGWRLTYSLPGGSSLVQFVANRLGHLTVAIPVGIGKGLSFRTGGGNPAYLLGAAEPDTQELLRRFLKEGDVLYDVGANVGFLSLIGACLVGPRGKVYAFESLPQNAAVLRANIARNGLDPIVEVVECAIADSNDTARMTINGSKSHFSGGHNPGDLEVVTWTLDTLISRRMMRLPTLVKIDVEGAEELVLRGMESQLQTRRPYVVCEIHGRPDGELARACISRLADASYEVINAESTQGGTAHIFARPA